MKNLTIKIDCEGSAFNDPAELPKIIRSIADKIESGKIIRGVLDSNGKVCGVAYKDCTKAAFQGLL